MSIFKIYILFSGFIPTTCIFYLWSQLDYTRKGLSVSLRRDVQKAWMLSSALQADADVESGGTYSESAMSLVDRHLKASRDVRAVTSVVCIV